jgi:hypothetical protein
MIRQTCTVSAAERHCVKDEQLTSSRCGLDPEPRFILTKSLEYGEIDVCTLARFNEFCFIEPDLHTF